MTKTKTKSKATRVEAAHEPGPLPNGGGNCFARWGHGGMCPGVEVAAWLNDLGPDDQPFGKSGTIRRNGKIVTNGDVRRNWVRNHGHLKEATS